MAEGDADADALAPPLRDRLGRYRLEHELGEGGMGVVHAAFDPELERRVALKVLRWVDDDGSARLRLLREARAMARLSHPNVVTVHEVGTADGRDYVAMELVDGQNLSAWLRAEPRSHHEIIEAFRAAARGLAAAHAAGLVHRDFKPHNVLRRKDGRVCVTDFGLARGLATPGPIDAPGSLETTLPLTARARKPRARPSASPLPTITNTGAIVGTPAYMAPEQWTGGTVGAAADQFSFCVALWEALTGERPFPGSTEDEIRRAVTSGAGAPDPAKLPRRLRPLLVRGLAADPAQRWRSMDELEAALARGTWRPMIAGAAAGAATLVAVVLYLAFRHGPAAACPPPLLKVDDVWNVERMRTLRAAGQNYAIDALTADADRWRALRADACHAEPTVRAAKLACLDGVLANLDLQARALATVKVANAEVGVGLVDPDVCNAPRPPRLVTTSSPARVAAAAVALTETVSLREHTLTAEAGARVVASAGDDPCALALAHVLAAPGRETSTEERRDFDDAAGAAQRCGDDRLSADVAYVAAMLAVTQKELDYAAKIKTAASAAENVMQPDLRAALDELRAHIARQNDRIDEAIALYESARDGYRARGRLRKALQVELVLEELVQMRARPDDLAKATFRLVDRRAQALQKLGTSDPLIDEITRAIADWMFSQGDIAGYHREVVASVAPAPIENPVHVSGRVVDAKGAPLAGATVTAMSQLIAEAVGLVPRPEGRSATTGADGTFDLPEAVPDGVVLASLGDLRSRPARVGEHLQLVLEATSRVSGTVDLRGEPVTNVLVFLHDPPDLVESINSITPVAPDGTFTIEHALRGPAMLRLQVTRPSTDLVAGQTVDVGEHGLAGLKLVVPSSKRVLHVLVRSTANMALPQATVFVTPHPNAQPGSLSALVRDFPDLMSREARPLDDQRPPASVTAKARPGDVYAAVNEAPEGDATACAVAIPTEVYDPDAERNLAKHLDRIEVRCKPVAPGDDVIEIEVPPWTRLDTP